MEHYDVIIIGGGPSGIVVGATAKKHYADKRFLMIKEEDKGLVPCGIPYVFHDLAGVDQNQMGPKPFVAAGGEVLVDSVTKVSLADKVVETASGKQFSYEKLIFATGSTPTVPTFIKGYDLENTFYIKKSYRYIKEARARLESLNRIIIVGGGFIGVEVAEQLAKYPEKHVSIVEKEAHCLSRAFSTDLCERAEKVITDAGIHLYTGVGVAEVLGQDGKVVGVKLADGRELAADAVIFSIGYRPNTRLAAEAGLELSRTNAIRVDNYQRTSEPDVYAIGDCAETTGFITGRTDNIMLASTATAESRILAYNLYTIKLKRGMTGTLSVFSTDIRGHSFAATGAVEQSAREANIDFITGQFEDVDRHPGVLPGASKLFAKLIVSPGDGSIIGGEMCGGKSVGELVNVVALAIQKGVTVFDLISYQIGTHPLLTSAPTKYILIKAAEDAMRKLYQK